jgi:hypothetical protein
MRILLILSCCCAYLLATGCHLQARYVKAEDKAVAKLDGLYYKYLYATNSVCHMVESVQLLCKLQDSHGKFYGLRMAYARLASLYDIKKDFPDALISYEKSKYYLLISCESLGMDSSEIEKQLRQYTYDYCLACIREYDIKAKKYFDAGDLIPHEI